MLHPQTFLLPFKSITLVLEDKVLMPVTWKSQEVSTLSYADSVDRFKFLPWLSSEGWLVGLWSLLEHCQLLYFLSFTNWETDNMADKTDQSPGEKSSEPGIMTMEAEK